MNEQIKILKEYLNSDQCLDPSNNVKICQVLTSLCFHKTALKISCLGRNVCMFCYLRINPNEKQYNLECPCFKTVHVTCFQKEGMFLIYDSFNNKSSKKLICLNCNKIITIEDLKKAIGFFEFNKICDEMKKNQRSQKEIEQFDQQMARKLQAQLRNELEDEEKFTCNMCFEDKKIKDHCITLKCDHKFCIDCLHDYLQVKIEERKISEKDLSCPSCLKTIEAIILQTILKKEEFSNLDKMMLGNLNPNILSKEEIFLKCPKAECNNVVVLPIKSKITHHKCEVCETDFCVRGCPKPHRPMTCEENIKYLEEQRRLEEERRLEEIKKIQEEAKRLEEMKKFNAWKEENDKGEERFNMMVQQENLRLCPRCNAWVQKVSGCNYILCRCTYEFCYVCSRHYPGHARSPGCTH